MSRRERTRPTTRRPELQDPALRSSAAPRGRAERVRAAPLAERRFFQALLPLRFFIGATFLYAGIDKFIDPRFLNAAGPGSIAEQLTAFTHESPLAGLVTVFALPNPVLIGVLMAMAEIAIGIGALTGLLYRASAAAGASVSLLFFLTASWSVHPYYYGPDLPYAAGWLTLALAGHGDLAVLRVPVPRSLAPDGNPAAASPERRALLQGGVIAAAALAVGGLAGFGGLLRGRDPIPLAADPAASPAATGSGASAGGPAVSAAPGASAGPVAGQIGSLSSLQPRTAQAFTDPTSGDPAVLIRLADGSVVAFDAVCTHQGCTVEYDPPSGLLFCPCHGAVFDPTHNADVLQGPAPVPLTALPIAVNKTTGVITLHG